MEQDIRITIKIYKTHSGERLYAVFMDGNPTKVFDTLKECGEYITNNLNLYSEMEACLLEVEK